MSITGQSRVIDDKLEKLIARWELEVDNESIPVFNVKIIFFDFKTSKKYKDLRDKEKQLVGSLPTGRWVYFSNKPERWENPMLYSIISSAALRANDFKNFTNSGFNFLDVHINVILETFKNIPYLDLLNSENIAKIQWNENCLKSLAKITDKTIVVRDDRHKPPRFVIFYPNSNENDPTIIEYTKNSDEKKDDVVAESSENGDEKKDDVVADSSENNLIEDDPVVESIGNGITKDDEMPIFFIQTQNSFRFAYMRSKDNALNFDITETELEILNQKPLLLSGNFKDHPVFENYFNDYITIGRVSEYGRDAHIYTPINFKSYEIDTEDPSFKQDILPDIERSFVYAVDGGFYNNAPQVISAALLFTPSNRFYPRQDMNFLSVRKSIDKKRGLLETKITRGVFRMFDWQDFTIASEIYNMNIFIRRRERDEITFYAKISPPTSNEDTITVMIEYRKNGKDNTFYLLLPEKLSEFRLEFHNSKYTPKEKSIIFGKEYAVFNNTTYVITPEFIEKVPSKSTKGSGKRQKPTGVLNRFSKKKPTADTSDSDFPIKSRSTKPSFPSSSSSTTLLPTSSSFERLLDDDDGEKEEDSYLEEEEDFLEANPNDNIPIMPQLMQNMNQRRYKYAKVVENIALIENFTIDSVVDTQKKGSIITRRKFDDNVLFRWRIEQGVSGGRRWPLANHEPIELVFIHKTIPIDCYTGIFPTKLLDGKDTKFFKDLITSVFSQSEPLEKTYVSTSQDFNIHARISNVHPFGVINEKHKAPLANGLIDVDGFMRFFDFIGSFVEFHKMDAHCYNLYRIYNSMLEDISKENFSFHHMTERILWFLYTFLMKDNLHFSSDNREITDEMTVYHGGNRELFSMILFDILFKSTSFKWQWKLSHVWLFAYLCLYPNQGTISVFYWRSELAMTLKYSFSETLLHNTSTLLMEKFKTNLFDSIDEKIIIPTSFLEKLISWDWTTGSNTQKLPLYTINHPLLFDPNNQESNRLRLSIEDLYYHTQIHQVIVHTYNRSTVATANVDAFLFSLQTLNGLPILSYRIDGFPVSESIVKNVLTHRFLHGDILKPTKTKARARFGPELTDFTIPMKENVSNETLEKKKALLLKCMRKTALYFQNSQQDDTLKRDPKRNEFFTLSIKEGDGRFFQLSGNGDYTWNDDDAEAVENRHKKNITDWSELYQEWIKYIAYFPYVASEKTNLVSMIENGIKPTSSSASQNFETLRKKITDSVQKIIDLVKIDSNKAYNLKENRKNTSLGTAIASLRNLIRSWDGMAQNVNEFNERVERIYNIVPLYPVTTPIGSSSWVLLTKADYDHIVNNFFEELNKSLAEVSNTNARTIRETIGIALKLELPDLPIIPPYPPTAPIETRESAHYVQPPFQHLLRNAMGLSLVGVEFIKRLHVSVFLQEELMNFKRRIATSVSSLDRILVQLLSTIPSKKSWAYPVGKKGFNNPSDNDVSYIRYRRDEIIFSAEEISDIVETRYLPDVLVPETYYRPQKIAAIYDKIASMKLITETPLRESSSQTLIDELVLNRNKFVRVPSSRTEDANFFFDPDYHSFYKQPWVFLKGISVFSAINTQTSLTGSLGQTEIDPNYLNFLKSIIFEGNNNVLQDVYKKISITCHCLRVSVNPNTDVPFYVSRYSNVVSKQYVNRYPDVRFGSPNFSLSDGLKVRYFIEYQVDYCFAMLPELKKDQDANDYIFFLHAPLFLEFMGIREVTNTETFLSSKEKKTIEFVDYLITFKVRISNEFILSMTPGYSNYHVRGYEYGKSQPTTAVSVSNNASIVHMDYDTPKLSKVPTRLFSYNHRLLNYVFWDGMFKERRYVPQVLSYLSETHYSTMLGDMKGGSFDGFDLLKPSFSLWKPNMSSEFGIEEIYDDITFSKYEKRNVSVFSFVFMHMEHYLGWPYPMAHYDTEKDHVFSLLSNVPIVYQSSPLYTPEGEGPSLISNRYLPLKPVNTDDEDSFWFYEPENSGSSSELIDDDGDVGNDNVVSDAVEKIGNKLKDDSFAVEGEDEDEEYGDSMIDSLTGNFNISPFAAMETARKLTLRYPIGEKASKARRKYLKKLVEYAPEFLQDFLLYIYDFPLPKEGEVLTTKKAKEQVAFVRRLNKCRLYFPEALWAAEDQFYETRFAKTKLSKNQKEKGRGSFASSSSTSTFVNTARIYASRRFTTLFVQLKRAKEIHMSSSPELFEDKIWSDRINNLKKYLKEDDPYLKSPPFTGIYPRVFPESSKSDEKLKDLDELAFFDDDLKQFDKTDPTKGYVFDNPYLYLQDYTVDVAYIYKTIQKNKINTPISFEKTGLILAAILAKEFNDYGFLYPDLKLVCVMVSENLYIILTRLLCRVENYAILRFVRENLWLEWIEQGYTVIFLPLFQVFEGKQEVGTNKSIPPVDSISGSSSSSSSSGSSSSSSSVFSDLLENSSNVKNSGIPTSDTLSDDEIVVDENEEFEKTYFTTKFFSRETSKKFLQEATNVLIRDVIFFKTNQKGSRTCFEFDGKGTDDNKHRALNVIIPRFLWHPTSDQKILSNLLERLQIVFGESSEIASPVDYTIDRASYMKYADSVKKQRFGDYATPLHALFDTDPNEFPSISSHSSILLNYSPPSSPIVVRANEKRRVTIDNFEAMLDEHNNLIEHAEAKFKKISSALKISNRLSDDTLFNDNLFRSFLNLKDGIALLNEYMRAFLFRRALKKYSIKHLFVEIEEPVDHLSLNDAVNRSKEVYTRLKESVGKIPIKELEEELNTIISTRTFKSLQKKVESLWEKVPKLNISQEIIDEFNGLNTSSYRKQILLDTALLNIMIDELKAKIPIPSPEELDLYAKYQTFLEKYKAYEKPGDYKAVFESFQEILPNVKILGRINNDKKVNAMYRKLLSEKGETIENVKYYLTTLKEIYETTPNDGNVDKLLIKAAIVFEERGLEKSATEVDTSNNPVLDPFIEDQALTLLVHQAFLQYLFEKYQKSESKVLNKTITTTLLTCIARKDRIGVMKIGRVLGYLFKKIGTGFEFLSQIENYNSKSISSIDKSKFFLDNDETWVVDFSVFSTIFSPEEIDKAVGVINLYYNEELRFRKDLLLNFEYSEKLLLYSMFESIFPLEFEMQSLDGAQEANFVQIYKEKIIQRYNSDKNIDLFMKNIFDIHILNFNPFWAFEILDEKGYISQKNIIDMDLQNCNLETNEINARRSKNRDAVRNISGFATMSVLLHSLFEDAFFSPCPIFDSPQDIRNLVRFLIDNKADLFNAQGRRVPLRDILQDKFKEYNIPFDFTKEPIDNKKLHQILREKTNSNFKEKQPWRQNKNPDVLIDHLTTTKKCSFTDFEKRMISFVWQKQQSFDFEQRYALVLKFREHDWTNLINNHDLLAIFEIEYREKRDAFFGSNSVLFPPDDLAKLTKSRNIVSEPPLSIIEKRLISGFLFFKISPNIILKLMMSKRMGVLFQLIKCKLIVSRALEASPTQIPDFKEIYNNAVDTIVVETSPFDSSSMINLGEQEEEINAIYKSMTENVVQQTRVYVYSQDTPESKTQTITMDDNILTIFMNTNNTYHDILGKIRDNALQNAKTISITSRVPKHKWMRTSNAIGLEEIMRESHDVLFDRKRLQVLNLTEFPLYSKQITVEERLNDENTLFKTLEYLLKKNGREVKEHQLIKDELILWLFVTENMDKEVFFGSTQKFKNFLTIPLNTNYPTGNNPSAPSAEKDAYLRFIQSPYVWSSFLFVLAAAHYYETPIHLVTSIGDSSNWHATIYPSLETISEPTTINILSHRMLYFYPLEEKQEEAVSSLSDDVLLDDIDNESNQEFETKLFDDGDYSPYPTSSSNPNLYSRRNDPSREYTDLSIGSKMTEFIGSSREKRHYMSHKHSTGVFNYQ